MKRIVLVAALFFALVPPASAEPVAVSAARHELGQSYLFMRIYEDSVLVRLEVTLADVERALGFGWSDPGSVTLADVQARLDSIRGYVEPRFSFSSAGEVIPLEFRDMELVDQDIARYVAIQYRLAQGRPVPTEVDVRFSVLFEADRDHRNMVIIEHNWNTGTFNAESNIALIFGPGTGAQSLNLESGSVLQGFLALVWLGVWHIWIGIDHILFLFALLLPAVLVRRDGRWQPVASFREALMNLVAIVTMFTLAHSVTLSLAAMDLVQLSSRLVESIIAASIAVAAWANLNPRLNIREWAIALLFGLFHGFGFASVLGDIGLGREHMVLSLLGFNIGVELGQLAIVVVAFPILYLLRTTRLYRYILRFGSYFLIAVALVWVYERVFGVDIWITRILLTPVRWTTG